MRPEDPKFWECISPSDARSRIVDALRNELLGPESLEEELVESPLTRYAVGMLAPFGTLVDESETDEETAAEDESEEAIHDQTPPLSQAINPSSIGLSFLLADPPPRLNVKAQWGEYASRERSEPTEGTPVDSLALDSKELPGPDQPVVRRRIRPMWVRSQHEFVVPPISLVGDGKIRRIEVSGNSAVYVEYLARKIGDQLAVSIFLVNRRQKSVGERPPVDHWIFQPQLAVTTSDGRAAFLPRALELSLSQTDRDLESNRLLFRNRREFAIGHGCATEWIVDASGSRANEVRTEIVPAYELPKTEAREDDRRGLHMSVLSTADSPLVLKELLSPLLVDYGAWIGSRRNEIDGLGDDHLRRIAAAHLDDCDIALNRMTAGLESLCDDPEAIRAFCFANRAMLLQRSHTVWARERKRNANTADAPSLEGRWRPFQLAFILLNLSGLIKDTSADRKVGDLLWFPTGGGKTEAYLGLAAFAMALRRRRSIPGYRTDAGTVVLMRYTLRLLTIQQFQRAATLLCACESIRRKDEDLWGSKRFSIGLWLGAKGTPNSFEDSRQALIKVQNDPADETPNACVLEACPWCGETIQSGDYWCDADRRQTLVGCPRNGCDFARQADERGIPVLSVDDEIYRECPAMILSTVDKFAQMPWNGETAALFGHVDRECDRCGFLTADTDHTASHRARGNNKPALVRETERLAPPDLIIQDELHLISGPLGTMVGLYEMAVDFLSSREAGTMTIRPKVVASTATVRRAFEQVQAIFARPLKVFPPAGLDPDDSFFASERPIGNHAPGRLYVGVCASGKSMKTAYIRAASALLSAASGVRQGNGAFGEPYATLVSYYNSLRELGGALRLLDDDIPARLEQLRTRGWPRHGRPYYKELTSRIRQTEIPGLLRSLETRFDSPRKDGDPQAIDVVLASNMISVGVDIDRLGMMTITGQPKTTAEYIQSSSRVGRQSWAPGLVIVLYNWSRPRDLSHYERFSHYHQTLYRNVEAVSATPFSSRALDRGLRGAYVAMVRLGDGDLLAERSAALFNPRAPLIAAVARSIQRRAEAITNVETGAMVAEAVKGLGDEWWGYRGQALRYGWRWRDLTKLEGDVLLRVPEGGLVGHWPAPQSLREVEAQSPVHVLGLRNV